MSFSKSPWAKVSLWLIGRAILWTAIVIGIAFGGSGAIILGSVLVRLL
jgi:hypothetical protein